MAFPPSLLRELSGVQGATVSADAPLAPLTTIRTGGKAGILVTAHTVEAVLGVLEVVQAHGVPWTCMGAGSDLLVADEGYRGVVIRLGAAFESVTGLPSAPRAQAASAVTVGAGVLVARFAAAAAKAGLAGLEFACGIPGSVGGGVATNAGAYGRSLADVLTEVPTGIGWGDALGAGERAGMGVPSLPSGGGSDGHGGALRAGSRRAGGHPGAS